MTSLAEAAFQSSLIVRVMRSATSSNGPLHAATGIEVTHEPTGISVKYDSGTSAHKSRDVAIKLLRTALKIRRTGTIAGLGEALQD